MTLHGIDHVNIDTTCLDETVAFYGGVLGLECRAKPPGSNNPGVWLYHDGHPIVHVNELPDQEQPANTGRFNHIAFAASGFDTLRAALDDGGYEYQVQRRDEIGVTQIFATDPNGIAVELNIAD